MRAPVSVRSCWMTSPPCAAAPRRPPRPRRVRLRAGRATRGRAPCQSRCQSAASGTAPGRTRPGRAHGRAAWRCPPAHSPARRSLPAFNCPRLAARRARARSPVRRRPRAWPRSPSSEKARLLMPPASLWAPLATSPGQRRFVPTTEDRRAPFLPQARHAAAACAGETSPGTCELGVRLGRAGGRQPGGRAASGRGICLSCLPT